MKRLSIAVVILICATIILPAVPSLADPAPMHITNRIGGDGGGPETRFACDRSPDDYIRGVEGFYGDWIDSFRLRCGRNLDLTYNGPWIGQHQTSKRTVVECGDGFAVVSIIVNTVNFHGSQIINHMTIYCQQLAGDRTYQAGVFGLGRGSPYQQQ